MGAAGSESSRARQPIPEQPPSRRADGAHANHRPAATLSQQVHAYATGSSTPSAFQVTGMSCKYGGLVLAVQASSIHAEQLQLAGLIRAGGQRR